MTEERAPYQAGEKEPPAEAAKTPTILESERPVPNLHLYELSENWLAVHQLLADGELDEEHAKALREALDIIGDDFDAKVANIGHVIRGIESEVTYIEDRQRHYQQEAERFRARATTRLNRVAWLLGYIRMHMEARGPDTQRVETPTISLTLGKVPKSDQLEVVNPAEVDPDFFYIAVQVPLRKMTHWLKKYVVGEGTPQLAKAKLNDSAEQGRLPPAGTVWVSKKRRLTVR